jgi:NADPH2:quinone reductase
MSCEAAAIEGRVVQIAFQASPKATVDFRRRMLKRLTHAGSTLRPRSVPEKAAIGQAVERHAAAIGRGQGEAVDRRHLCARSRRRRACPHGRSVHIGKIVSTCTSS